MKYLYHILSTFLVITLLFSCKDDKKTSETENVVEVETVVKKEPTPEQIKIANSVLSKAMMTPELKTFIRALVTTQLTETLSKEDGPFTIFAPTSEAFDEIDKEKMQYYLSPDNMTEFTQMLKTHIIAGNIDSGTLLQSIKANNGKYDFQNMAGGTLTASLKGSDIVVSDSLGLKATIGKSDITGSNGVIHLLDAVLGVIK